VERRPQDIATQQVAAGGIARQPEWFGAACRENGVNPTEDQIRKLERFARLLLEWNKKINLISRRDEERFWSRHILHSISILFKLRLPRRASVIDIGTGGGLPGIPLKILLPQISLTLLDSTQKKINVVQNMLQELSLSNVCAVWARAEELGKQADHCARYDLVVARAVAPLRDLIRWSKPLLKPVQDRGGEFATQPEDAIQVEPPALIALKGGDLEREVRSAKRVSGVQSIRTIDLMLQGVVQLEADDKKIVYVTCDHSAVGTSRSQP
jgi:16S rRNA (guanine527-N7)-methyltransferase